ncbi:lysylphosphatidylglycerol synthase domain-containing protein [Collimonas sp. OK412]|jgi:hypothetical protein|uniref:lysylphosphatidylglycerol synthase domain-containing protein n=1 Tax=Collimonas sp. (strain OK412) TaxID=1801619 RepID=UPI0008E087B5|nr:lysylphosphatidylglycerol synthase domain-containing protein [Collimonas sp. OK412]SFC49220.1 hypothetical protein SAMN04515619_108128 [Collimonas sp. OK412]
MLKKIYRLLALLIGLAAIIVFAGYSIKTLSIENISHYARSQVLEGIIVAALFYATIIPVSAWAWKNMLANINCPRSWYELSMIMGITQIAKYLPGNIGQHIGRAAMSMTRGISIRPFLLTVFSETLLTLLAALAIGSVGVFFSQSGLTGFAFVHQTIFILTLIGILVLALLLYRPLVPHLLKRFFPAHTNSSLEGLLPGTFTLLRSFAAYSLNYVMIGIGFFLMATILLPDVKHDFMLLLASFSLAWVAGFVAPGAPAGLGVREVIMLGVLSTNYSGSNGLLIIASFRLATILGDSLCFLIAYLMLFFSRRATPSS